VASIDGTDDEARATGRRYVERYVHSWWDQDRILRLGHAPSEGDFWRGLLHLPPGRWLEATGDRLRYMENSNELVFGSGRYKCLGNPIAFVELNKVFVEVCDYSLVLFMEPLLR
jgi:hypothetical protein